MKWLSIWMATAMAVFRASAQTSQPTAVQVNSQAPTYLYGGQASKLAGDVKKRGGDNFGWKGSGALTWEVQIAKSGELMFQWTSQSIGTDGSIKPFAQAVADFTVD